MTNSPETNPKPADLQLTELTEFPDLEFPRRPTPIPEGEEDLCRALWLAVIVQAVNDARSGRSRLCYRRDRKNALDWIHGLGPDEGRDFEKVCELAGVDPVKLRREIDLALEGRHEGFTFRCLTKHSNCARRNEPEGRRAYFGRLRRSDAQRLRRAQKLSEQARRSVDA